MVQQAVVDKRSSESRDPLPAVDIVEHHALCEINFHRMLMLLPQLREGRESWKMRMGMNGNINIVINVLDLAPYTTTVEVSQQYSGVTSSKIRVRLYHDVEMAEIVAWDHHRNWYSHYQYPNPKMYHPDEKLALNKYLNDWLLFCSREGNAGRRLCDLVLVNKK